jgi:hypothetical protein
VDIREGRRKVTNTELEPTRDIAGAHLAVGDCCMICQSHNNDQEYVGRRVTVREIYAVPHDPMKNVRVDDGDPSDSNIITNGCQLQLITYSRWLGKVSRPPSRRQQKRKGRWVAVEWIRKADLDNHDITSVFITRMTSPFYEGVKFAVIKDSACLNKAGEWVHNRMPSSRDADFFRRCRFDSFEEAAALLEDVEERKRLRQQSVELDGRK